TTVCASMRCACSPFPATYIACRQGHGCLTGLDCSVACQRDLGDVLECAGSYAPCTTDADCGSGRCVRADGSPSGDCHPGISGDLCLDAGGCLDGACVAVASDGTRKCQNRGPGAACNLATDCAPSLPCILPEHSFVGTCSDGSLQAACAQGSDCQ